MSDWLKRYTSMRGRLALLLIIGMVAPIAVIGLLGYSRLARAEHEADPEAHLKVMPVGVTLKLNAAATGFSRFLDGALKDLELRTARVVSLTGEDLQAGFDDFAEAARPTAIIEVAPDGECRPALPERQLELLASALAARHPRAGYATLPTGLDGASLFQVVIEPRPGGGHLLVLRDLGLEAGGGLLDTLPLQDGFTRLVTLGDRTLNWSAGLRNGEAHRFEPGQPEGQSGLIAKLWRDAEAGDGDGEVQYLQEAGMVAAADVLLDLQGQPVGLAVVRASELDVYPYTRRINALISSVLSLIGWIALTGVLAAVVIGMAAPHCVWHDLRNSTMTIFSAVDRLRSLVQRNSRALDEQSTLIRSLQGSVGSLREASRTIAETARSLAHSADQSAWVSQSGNQKAELAQRGVLDVRDRVSELSDQMEELERRCGEIGSILDFIDHLSNETNTLSINATIQAAGSGSSGRQFSVVAGEIRKLADMALDSTRDIHQLVEQIQGSSHATLGTTQEGCREVDRALASFEELESAFARILRWVEETTQSAQAIEQSTAHQSDWLQEVVRSIEKLQERARETANNSHDVVVAAEDLAKLGDEMTETWRVG
jgi:methyl-accepting chemotaxis protein